MDLRSTLFLPGRTASPAAAITYQHPSRAKRHESFLTGSARSSRHHGKQDGSFPDHVRIAWGVGSILVLVGWRGFPLGQHARCHPGNVSLLNNGTIPSLANQQPTCALSAHSGRRSRHPRSATGARSLRRPQPHRLYEVSAYANASGPVLAWSRTLLRRFVPIDQGPLHQRSRSGPAPRVACSSKAPVAVSGRPMLEKHHHQRFSFTVVGRVQPIAAQQTDYDKSKVYIPLSIMQDSSP